MNNLQLANDKFKKLDLEIKYNISYNKSKNFDTNEYKIVEVLFSSDILKTHFIFTDYNYYEGCCRYCGEGNDRYIILKFSNNDYGYLKYWNSCLTYDSVKDTTHTLEICDTLENLITYSLTDDIRNLYLQHKNTINDVNYFDENSY